MTLQGIRKFWTTGHRIQERVEISSGFGGPVYEWVDKISVDGRLRKIGGKEPMTGDMFRKDIDARFYCDSGLDITNEHRYVSPDGEWYHIEFINDVMEMDIFTQIDLKYGGQAVI